MRKVLTGLVGIGMYAISFAGVIGFNLNNPRVYPVKDKFDEIVSVIEEPFRDGRKCILGIDNNDNGIISLYREPLAAQIKITGRPNVYEPMYFVRRSYNEDYEEWRGIIELTPEDKEFLKKQNRIELRVVHRNNKVKKYELKK